jgi:hypothetical protein
MTVAMLSMFVSSKYGLFGFSVFVKSVNFNVEEKARKHQLLRSTLSCIRSFDTSVSM